MFVLSRVQLFVTLWTVARQAPLSVGFSRQEYWSGLPFPPPGDIPDPGTKPTSPALAGGFFTTELPGIIVIAIKWKNWDLNPCQLRNGCLWTVVLEKTLESPLHSNKLKPVNLKGNQPWILIGRTEAEAETPVFWSLMWTADSLKSPWCWERLRAEGEEGVRGWGGWMASPIQWTWTWANFRRWWGTGRSGVLQSMGSQRVRRDWATEQQPRTESMLKIITLLTASCWILLPVHWRFMSVSVSKFLWYFGRKLGMIGNL